MTDAVLILSQFFAKKGQPNNELKKQLCLQVLSPFFVEWKSERENDDSATKECTKVAHFWQNALSWCFWAHNESLNQRERKSIYDNIVYSDEIWLDFYTIIQSQPYIDSHSTLRPQTNHISVFGRFIPHHLHFMVFLSS